MWLDDFIFDHKDLSERDPVALTERQKTFLEEDSKELRVLLHKFMKVRNAFAHGEIVFKQKFEPYLIYYSGGRQVDPLTPAYFEEIYTTVSLIRGLSEKIRKKVSGWKV